MTPSDPLPPYAAPNRARGEVAAVLGGQWVRLCVTLGALAQMEGHFGVRSFTALAQRLSVMGAADVQVVLGLLALDDLPSAEGVSLTEAIAAIIAAFGAMNAEG